MSNTLLISIASAVLVIAILILVSSANRRKSLGLPSGTIVYSDPGILGKVDKPLYDAELGLTGKPDYVVERRGRLIPVEVKSGWAPEKPYDSHIMQLASYCWLLERNFRKRPPYGILKYKNRTFAIRYTDELRQNVIDLVDEIRSQKEYGEPDRSHENPNRCERCGFRFDCDQRL
ncbi:MAG TPA: CRISPR-associated protein Cas4 [Anaerolineaceae bacterium]|jgi:CRISPR-associated exonuclease Cas4|nr:CRISPR-associated protein Cas4 [Anaerolineaceae bacterium]